MKRTEKMWTLIDKDGKRVSPLYERREPDRNWSKEPTDRIVCVTLTYDDGKRKRTPTGGGKR